MLGILVFFCLDNAFHTGGLERRGLLPSRVSVSIVLAKPTCHHCTGTQEKWRPPAKCILFFQDLLHKNTIKVKTSTLISHTHRTDTCPQKEIREYQILGKEYTTQMYFFFGKWVILGKVNYLLPVYGEAQKSTLIKYKSSWIKLWGG